MIAALPFLFVLPDGREHLAHIGHTLSPGDAVIIDGAAYTIDPGPARLERHTLFGDAAEWRKRLRVTPVQENQ